MPWSTVVEQALYGPGGFYASGGGAGLRRDFLTSPEMGSVFATVVARAIDEAWVEAGRPDPWFVVEAGAGTGTLARSVLTAAPSCNLALRYVAVETSPALRAVAASRLPLEDPSQLLGPRAPAGGEDADTAPVGRSGIGPLITVLADLPAGPLDGVVIANELLDNLPFDVYQWSPTGWDEVRVAWVDEHFSDVLVPAAADVAGALTSLVPAPHDGARVPWQSKAAAWVSAAVDVVARGRVIAFDYGRTTAALAEAGEEKWLRTYRSGGPGSAPLLALGEQDLTSDVALDQLPPPSRMESQAAWLSRHGIDLLAEEAASAWRERRVVGDLAALRSRSIVQEVVALCDPDGLGAFTVCEWGPSAQS